MKNHRRHHLLHLRLVIAITAVCAGHRLKCLLPFASFNSYPKSTRSPLAATLNHRPEKPNSSFNQSSSSSSKSLAFTTALFLGQYTGEILTYRRKGLFWFILFRDFSPSLAGFKAETAWQRGMVGEKRLMLWLPEKEAGAPFPRLCPEGFALLTRPRPLRVHSAAILTRG